MSLKIPLDLNIFKPEHFAPDEDIIRIEIKEVIVEETIVVLDIYHKLLPDIVAYSRKYSFYTHSAIEEFAHSDNNISGIFLNMIYVKNLLKEYFPELLLI